MCVGRTIFRNEMENSSKEEVQINLTLECPPRFKAGADLSKKVSRVEVKAMRRPRFKAGSDLSGKVNLGINVSGETTETEEHLSFVFNLTEELKHAETEA